jgi:geranylgeranyl reductase family protein
LASIREKILKNQQRGNECHEHLDTPLKQGAALKSSPEAERIIPSRIYPWYSSPWACGRRSFLDGSKENTVMDTQKFDIVIVGAGIAGLTAGIHLRKRDLNVLIIEKAVFPRKKLCGGFLTYPAIREIAELGLDCTDSAVFYPSSDVFIHYQGKELQLTQNAFLVNRFEFDYLLYKKFKEMGGSVTEGVRAIRIADDTTLILDNGSTLGFNVLIGADGANSIVRKYLNRDIERSDGLCIGKNYSLPIPSSLPQGFHLYMDLIDEGYGWCFAHTDRYASVGVGGTKKEGGRVMDAAKQLFAQLGVDEPHVEGAIIPNGRPAKKLASKNIFLVGDATGLVDSVLGEGIYPALLAGRIIGSKVGAGFTERIYRKELKELTGICQSARLLSKLMADKNIKDILVKKGFSHPHFLTYLCEEIVLEKNQNFSRILPSYMKGRKKLSLPS